MTAGMRARAAAAVLGLGLAAGALAQAPSTGNPKGSIAPATEGSTANPPANPARTISPGPSGVRDSGKAEPKDRGQRAQQSGGVTGSGTGDPNRRDAQGTTTVPMPPPRKPAADSGR